MIRPKLYEQRSVCRLEARHEPIKEGTLQAVRKATIAESLTS